MKQLLHKPHGKNRYCGPAVISAITGISSDDVGAILRVSNPSRGAVKGMHNREIIHVINELGGRAEQVPKKLGRRTLQAWMEERTGEERNKFFVVVASSHYLLVHRDLVLCSVVKREWVNILSHPYRRRYFKSAIEVVPPKTKAVVPKAVDRKREHAALLRRVAAKDKREAARLMKRLDLEVQRDQDLMIVGLSNGGGAMYAEMLAKHGLDADTDLEDVFYNEVLGGESIGHDWSDVRRIVGNVAEFVRRETGIVVA